MFYISFEYSFGIDFGIRVVLFFTMHESWRAVVWIESEWETEVPKCGHEWRLTSMLGTWTATMTIMHAIWRDYMVRLRRIFDLFVSAPMHFKIGRLFATNILMYVYVFWVESKYPTLNSFQNKQFEIETHANPI